MVRRQHPFDALVREMSQVQDDFATLFNRLSGYDPRPAAGALPVNLWEDADALHVETDLPGLDPARLDITVTEGNLLTIQGERPAPAVEGAAWVRQERPFGTFTRSVRLPALVDADKVEARYDHGVLRVTLPRSEAAKPRKIAVQAGG